MSNTVGAMSLLAKYESGMRRGQGFNSYTLNLCLDDAVLIQPAGALVDDHHKLTNGTADLKLEDVDKPSSVQPVVASPPGKNVDQIVVFSCRQIDNMSDIIDSLDLSSSASIKYGTVKASGSASFVNENKVNDSDLNYLVTVKVTNATPTRSDTMVFNPIKNLKAEDFPAAYGDCFIADFLEGGDFSAIISIKVQSKSDVKKVKAAADLELAVGPPGLSVEAKSDYEKNKSDVWKDTETTISVNWSGGGDIKDPEASWDLPTVIKTANEFPSRVVNCSQRTSAVLMKYTSLRNFHEINGALEKPYGPLRVLDYSYCEIYTTDLFSAYNAYKKMWKSISNMMKQPRSYQALEKTKDVPDPIQTDPTSLNLARRECRKAMTQILQETKLLATHPEVAGVDAQGNLRAPQYTFPAVLGRRLPRYDPSSIEDEEGNFKDFSPEEMAVIGQFLFNDDLHFSNSVGNENPVRNTESHIFCSLLVNPSDKLDYLTNIRIHAHQHHLTDHFRGRFPNISHYSRECERAISGVGFSTSRNQVGADGDPRANIKCKCGLRNHVGRNEHEMESIDEKFLSRPATLSPDGNGITKVIVGYVPGTFRVASLIMSTADGMKVCEWNMYDDLKPEKRPKLETKVLTPPEAEEEEDGKQVVKWVLAGFWGRADLVVERLGVIWRRV